MKNLWKAPVVILSLLALTSGISMGANQNVRITIVNTSGYSWLIIPEGLSPASLSLHGSGGVEIAPYQELNGTFAFPNTDRTWELEGLLVPGQPEGYCQQTFSAMPSALTFTLSGARQGLMSWFTCTVSLTGGGGGGGGGNGCNGGSPGIGNDARCGN